MELGGSDHLSQLLHIGGFDVNNVEALILNIEVPEVDAQIVTANEGFAITVHGYAVDVVRVGICIGSSGDGGDNSIVVCEARQFEVGRISELLGRGESSKATASAHRTARRYIVGKIVLCHHLQRLFKNLPQLDRLVIG